MGGHRQLTHQWGLGAGEVLEAAGRPAAAKRAYMEVARTAEIRSTTALSWASKQRLTAIRVTGLYRAARSSLSDFRSHGTPEALEESINIIEEYRARAMINEMLKQMGDKPHQLRLVQFSELRIHLPRGVGMLTFSLMQTTPLNPGFWFVALLDPSSGSILHPRFVELDDIYQPVANCAEVFRAARTAVTGQTLFGAREIIEAHSDTVDNALSRLGDVLFPSEVIEEIERRELTRLLIIPEGYLYDVPFGALRVRTSTGTKHLFEVNLDRGGLSFSIIPNWASLSIESAIPRVAKPKVDLAVMTALRPEWRPDIAPIFGVIERIGAAIGPGNHRDKGVVFENNVNVEKLLAALRDSRVAIFFGHGEIDDEHGVALIANNGRVGELEIRAAFEAGSFTCRLVVLCACSSVNSHTQLRFRTRDLAGVHAAMVSRGIRFVIGAAEPIFPVVGVRVIEIVKSALDAGHPLDQTVRTIHVALSKDPHLKSPIFWGHITGFGEGLAGLGDIHQ